MPGEAISIGNLEIEISQKSSTAAKDIDKLSSAIGRLGKIDLTIKSLSEVKKQIAELKDAVKPPESLNISTSISQLKKLPQVISDIARPLMSVTGDNKARIQEFVDAMKPLETMKPLNLHSTFNQMAKLPQLMSDLAMSNWTIDPTKIQGFVDAMKPLETLGKTSIASYVNNLSKLPDVLSQLDALDMDKFGASVQKVADALTPLAEKMTAIAAGFSAFPSKLQKLVVENNNVADSFNTIKQAAKLTNLKYYYQIFERIANKVGDVVEKSNDFQESMNLFRVSMGQYYDEALQYGEKVSDTLGIDLSEWIKYQAVFMNMASGFGIISDKAYLMSKNLTQLGYDLASVFNTDFNTAMEKLQSALSGQPRPMREWGFDLSEASIKAVALAHGIDKNVESMNQAEKAQLRYIQLIETAQKLNLTGDFAATLSAPANALRVLKNQGQMLAREIGNIIIPALNAIIPVAIAVTKALRLLAASIASLFGFELTKIDYSSLTGAAVGAEDMEEALGGASAAASELKKTVMGFDELNLLNEPSVGGGGGVGAGGDIGDVFSDITLPEYDFLERLVEGKVDGIVDSIMRLFAPDTVAAAKILDEKFGSIALSQEEIAFWAQKLTTSDLSIKLGLFADELTTERALQSEIESIVTNLNKKNWRVMIGMDVEYDDYMADVDDLIATTLEYIDQKKVVATMAIDIVLGDSTSGATLTQFATEYYNSYYSTVQELGNNLKAVLSEAFVDGEWIPDKMQEAMNIQQEIQDVLDIVSEAEMTAKLQMITLELLGTDVTFEDYKATAAQAHDLLQENLNNSMESYTTTLTIANLQLKTGEITQSEYDAILEEINDNFSNQNNSLSIKYTEWIDATNEAVYSDAAQAVADVLGTRVSDATGGVIAAAIQNEDFVGSGAIGTSADMLVYMYTAALNDAGLEKGTKQAFSQVYDEITRLAIENNQTIYDEAYWNGAQVPAGLADSINDEQHRAALLGVVDAQLYDIGRAYSENASFFDLLAIVEGAGESIDASTADGIRNNISVLFDEIGNTVTFISDTFGEKTLEITPTLIDNMNELGLGAGDGVFAGIKESVNENKPGLEHLFDVGIKGVLEEKWGELSSWWSGLELDGFKIRIPKLDLIWNPVDSVVARFFGVTAIPSLNLSWIEAFANGGFPDAGQLFLANEAGPELVGSMNGQTAVANNDQIVEGIRQGVYEAVVAAMSGSGGEQRIELFVDGKKMADTVTKYQRGAQRATGVA